jgi:hypothetical protein
MNIPGSVPSASLTLTPLAASTPAWTPGQVLSAVVDSILGGDRVALRIGASLIEAEASGSLSVGERLNLQVVRNEAQLLLRVLAPNDESPAPPATPRTTQTAAGTVLTLRAALPAALAPRPGTMLQAVVTARSGERVTLSIGDRSFEARASQALTPGQRLHVQVVRTERPAVLRVVEENGAGEALRSAMRAALPRQLPLKEVFALLGALPAGPGGTLLKHLLQNLPEAENITRGDAFKAAVKNAGQLLEHRLERDASAAELRQDLKANLLRLLAALNQAPEEGRDLARQIGAAVANIQLHQLAAAAPDPSAPAWAGEIPLRRGDQVDVCRLRVEKDGGNDGDQRPSGWSTWLSLELPALGPLHARLSLSGFTLATTLWAESDATAARVNEHLGYLRQALEGAGLEVADLQCHRGRPPFLPPDRLPAGLLDILA